MSLIYSMLMSVDGSVESRATRPKQVMAVGRQNFKGIK